MKYETNSRSSAACDLLTEAILSGLNRDEKYRAGHGYAVFGQVLMLTESKNWRVGGEFQFRDFKTEFFSVDDVSTQMYQLSALVHYRILPEAPVVPYMGGGLGFSINVIDADKIEDQRPNVDVSSSVGGGAGIFAAGGLEVVLGERVVLFGEARITGEVQLTETSGSIDAENTGGFVGLGGIRYRF